MTPRRAGPFGIAISPDGTFGGAPGFPAVLNPPAALAGGTAPLRFTPPDAGAAGVAETNASDQINCILRNVGTFPRTLDAAQDGITPAGGVRVREVRANMTTPAQGATGFSAPALIGLGPAAPYFHAGNARTLEEVFDPTFASHHQALSANFLIPPDPNQVRQLVAFLLSIDDSTPLVAIPSPDLQSHPVPAEPLIRPAPRMRARPVRIGSLPPVPPGR